MNILKPKPAQNPESHARTALLEKLNRFDGVLAWNYVAGKDHTAFYQASGKPKAVRAVREKLERIANDVRDHALLREDGKLDVMKALEPITLEPVAHDENSLALVIPAEIVDSPEFLRLFKRELLNSVTVGVRVVATEDMPKGVAPIHFRNVIGKPSESHTADVEESRDDEGNDGLNVRR